MSVVAESGSDEQVVVFRLEGEHYALDIFRINEIIRMRDITPIPHSYVHLRGLVNLRGKTIPVIDLRVRFGMEAAQPTDDTRIIVVETSDGLVGVIVDEVSEVITLSQDQIERTPEMIRSDGTDFIRAVGKHEGQLITMLDLDRSVAAQTI